MTQGMTREELGKVLKVVAAGTRRTFGEADLAIWHPIIKDIPVDFAVNAVMAHFKENPGVWLEPGHIYQRWKVFRQDELQRLSREERSAREDAIDAKVLGAAALVKEIPAGDVPVKFHRRKQPELSVVCPWCHAGKGSQCTVPQTDEALTGFHPSRTEAAKETESA